MENQERIRECAECGDDIYKTDAKICGGCQLIGKIGWAAYDEKRHGLGHFTDEEAALFISTDLIYDLI